MTRILFAGAGTAGHIEPAWAVSQAWSAKHPEDEVAFLGTANGQEVELIPNRGGTLFLIPKVTAPRAINLRTLAFPIQLLNSAIKTISIVKDFDLVVGFGGYVSASAYLAAAALRKPIVIHEQNAKVGIANKLGNRFTSEVLVAYPEAIKEFGKGVIVGNPLKAEIVSAAVAAASDWAGTRANAKRSLGVEGPLVLVLGGSSGSTYINEVIGDTDFKGCTVIHSLGRANLGEKNKSISGNFIYRPVSYIEDMATALLASDLVISRSGAVATAEIAALGKYALFVPLPIGNGEQALNAAELVKAGRAELRSQKDFNSKWLSQNLARMLGLGKDEAFGTNLNATQLILSSMERAIR